MGGGRSLLFLAVPFSILEANNFYLGWKVMIGSASSSTSCCSLRIPTTAQQLSRIRFVSTTTPSTFLFKTPQERIGTAHNNTFLQKPDFHSLEIRPLDDWHRGRQVALYDTAPECSSDQEDGNTYYQETGDPVGNNTTSRCRKNAWYGLLFLTCNTVHEYDTLELFRTGSTKFVGAGAFRDVFLTRATNDERSAWKSYRLDLDYDTFAFESMRVDALVAERLSSNHRIINIYASCGLAGIHEASVHGHVGNIAIPRGVGRIEEPHDGLQPQNTILPKTKLILSLQMTEAVAALHNFRDGAIVHSDIQMTQFLLGEEGDLKLNDFNTAKILSFSEPNYCRFQEEGPAVGDWRSPEEYVNGFLTEKVDIWSLGNNMYTLLTGLMPFYTTANFTEIKSKILRHETAYIDRRWKEKSFAEGRLAEIIPRCWAFDPEKRVDALEPVRLLRDAAEEDIKRAKGA